MTAVKSLNNSLLAHSCFFRSSVEYPNRKALLQITERCNLKCAHCFVSAGDYGDTMPLEVIKETVIPRLKQCRVSRVSLTGGEPFAHPEIIEIVRAFRDVEIPVGICTSATTITAVQIDTLAGIGGVHLNVSLDGFRPESHGKFRGDVGSFSRTIEIVRQLAKRQLVQGLLVTPNRLAEVQEYAELCAFAKENGAKYVLMNPLSPMGRGTKSKPKLASSDEEMRKIQEITSPFNTDMEILHIRFPNETLPLASCEAGNIIYVFVQGDLTVCPYLVFAAKTPQSRYRPEEFMPGNILKDTDIAAKLDAYGFHDRYRVGTNSTCQSCALAAGCGKGCPAAVIASGRNIGEVDTEVCPVEPSANVH